MKPIKMQSDNNSQLKMSLCEAVKAREVSQEARQSAEHVTVKPSKLKTNKKQAKASPRGRQEEDVMFITGK